MGEDRSICPVRALQTYISRACEIRRDKKLLFVSHRTSFSKDIHKNTLSGWIKLILFVYGNASSEVFPLSNTRTHEVLTQAASLAFRGSADLEDLLQDCSSSSFSTFAAFYLRDLYLVQGNLRRLGPIVAAQKVVRT